jgi:hypothetical protein
MNLACGHTLFRMLQNGLGDIHISGKVKKQREENEAVVIDYEH